MESIEPSALYDERGTVSLARPLLQGDVFTGIVLPGFGDDPRTVQVIAHPCAMRRGPDLTERVTVAPVEPHSLVTGQSGWDGNLRVMPLPELRDSSHFATRFVDATAAPSELLVRSNRIATLSNRGILILQQRLTKHYTRVEMEIELLRRESAPVLTEAELQWSWVEDVLSSEELEDEAAVEQESASFDAWLSEGQPSRRAQLQREVTHSDMRREAQRAAAARANDREVR